MRAAAAFWLRKYRLALSTEKDVGFDHDQRAPQMRTRSRDDTFSSPVGRNCTESHFLSRRAFVKRMIRPKQSMTIIRLKNSPPISYCGTHISCTTQGNDT